MTPPLARRFTVRHRVLAVQQTIGLLLCAATAAGAQAAQPYSAQLSALVTSIRVGTTSFAGSGVEVQQRFNRIYSTEGFGAVSIGIGGQYTVHTKAQDRLQSAGLFIEPRYVPPGNLLNCLFPYLSARLAVQRITGTFQSAAGGSSYGTAFGGGGGAAIKLSRTVNLDAGIQLVRQDYGDIGARTIEPVTTYIAKVGVSVGYPR